MVWDVLLLVPLLAAMLGTRAQMIDDVADDWLNLPGRSVMLAPTAGDVLATARELFSVSREDYDPDDMERAQRKSQGWTWLFLGAVSAFLIQWWQLALAINDGPTPKTLAPIFTLAPLAVIMLAWRLPAEGAWWTQWRCRDSLPDDFGWAARALVRSRYLLLGPEIHVPYIMRYVVPRVLWFEQEMDKQDVPTWVHVRLATRGAKERLRVGLVATEPWSTEFQKELSNQFRELRVRGTWVEENEELVWISTESLSTFEQDDPGWDDLVTFSRVVRPTYLVQLWAPELISEVLGGLDAAVVAVGSSVRAFPYPDDSPTG